MMVNKKYLIILISLSAFCKFALVDCSQKSINVGERVKSVIATELWHKADELAHKGSIDEKFQKFIAGSYVGNTDIIPLLKAVVYLKPQETLPYRVLSQSLIYSNGNLEQAQEVLIQGIKANKNSVNVHELLASIATLKMFYDKSPKGKAEAIEYLNQAINTFPNGEYEPSDPLFSLNNYYLLLSRLYIETDEPKKALDALDRVNISLYSSEDIIFKYLRKYKATGVSDKTMFNEENQEKDLAKHKNDVKNISQGFHEHSHNHSFDNEKKDYSEAIKKSLFLNPFFMALKTGVLFIFMLLFARFKKRFT